MLAIGGKPPVHQRLEASSIERELRRLLKERGLRRIVPCMGLRAEESPGRAMRQPLRKNERNSAAGREWLEWLPIHKLLRGQVFEVIRNAGESSHPAYALGNNRLSCMFCIMGSRNDLQNAAPQNPSLFRRYVEMERRTGYTMHQSRLPLEVLVGFSVEERESQGFPANV